MNRLSCLEHLSTFNFSTEISEIILLKTIDTCTVKLFSGKSQGPTVAKYFVELININFQNIYNKSNSYCEVY